MFVGGYFMMQQSKLDEMCYILYCSVILLNLSASTICVLVMGQEEARDDEVFVEDNERIQNETHGSRDGEEEDNEMENALLEKVKGTTNKESFVSGSTAATFLTRTTKLWISFVKLFLIKHSYLSSY